MSGQTHVSALTIISDAKGRNSLVKNGIPLYPRKLGMGC